MKLVHSEGGYDFYIRPAMGNRGALYNIVPAGSAAPDGGYPRMEYIEGVKGVLFPARYQRSRKYFPMPRESWREFH
jgi:hypothetical protein